MSSAGKDAVESMRSKTRSDDWVRLAGAALNARDGLRVALAELQAIIRLTEDAETRQRAARVLGAVARECDRLRYAGRTPAL